MDAVTIYKHEDTGLEFHWQGGEYIDVGYPDETGEFVARDCINVWDHAAGEAEISGLAEFEQTCDEWLAEQV